MQLPFYVVVICTVKLTDVSNLINPRWVPVSYSLNFFLMYFKETNRKLCRPRYVHSTLPHRNCVISIQNLCINRYSTDFAPSKYCMLSAHFFIAFWCQYEQTPRVPVVPHKPLVHDHRIHLSFSSIQTLPEMRKFSTLWMDHKIIWSSKTFPLILYNLLIEPS